MKYKILSIIILLLFIAGCSSYTELSPDPELTPAELGYIELKDDDDNFELEAGEKYFVNFPKPDLSNFYLVLKLSNKKNLDFYLTPVFDDGEGEASKVQDVYSGHDSLSVYRIKPADEQYFWVIENVKQNELLQMDYRYVPMWRFKFEMKYAEYKNILETNRVDRSIYNAIDENYNLSQINFGLEAGKTKNTLAQIKLMNDELKELASLFPSSISNSTDPAYRNFIELSEAVNEEIIFQENYLATMEVFQRESKTGGSIGDFISEADYFLSYLNDYPNIPDRIKNKAKSIFASRLAKAPDYYEDLIIAKRDAKPFGFNPNINVVSELYSKSTNNVPASFKDVSAYLSRFELEANALQKANEKLADLDGYFRQEGSWPSNSFYDGAITRIKAIQPILPNSMINTDSKFRGYHCTGILEREVTNTQNKLRFLLDGYKTARVLVPRINELAEQNAYKNIISLLNQNRGLAFLLDQYPDVDGKALAQQKAMVERMLRDEDWAGAENLVASMYRDKNYVFMSNIYGTKLAAVRDYEEKIYQAVKLNTRKKLEEFAESNYMNIDNVENLYSDKIFSPVYDISFSSKGEADLARKVNGINDYINNLKHDGFPAISIENIYRDFLRNKSRRGVEKCRAIVTHGKYYKGSSSKIKNMIYECDPQFPKWVKKRATYRTLNALPVTSNKAGTNEYMFKVALDVPKEGKFPVFEINIKLPKEVAQNAASAKWYKTMKLDKTLIKNEGRIKITAPTAENDWEFKISPVQMHTDDRNVLEVRFDFPAFKVLEVSCMAQKPIITRN